MKNDHIKIGDFGIAKNMFDEQSAEKLGKGTINYMSPELILLNYGTDISIENDDLKKKSNITFKSDIWYFNTFLLHIRKCFNIK